MYTVNFSVRMPSRGGKNNWEGVEREGPDIKEVGDTLPCAGWRLSCSSRSPGSSTGPRSLQRNVGKTGLFKEA